IGRLTVDCRSKAVSRASPAAGGTASAAAAQRQTRAQPETLCTVYTGWDALANLCSDRIGRRFSFTCPPNGTLGSVWGTNVYYTSSSVCSAAVHAGLITRASGGAVIIEIRHPQKTFTASERHGVRSAYMYDSPAFVFVH